VVWPEKKLRETKASSSSSHFTLQAGSYTFPFRLRLPVNNACQPPPGPMSMQNYHFTNNAVTTVSYPLGHVKQTLPPSLGGVEDAWIRFTSPSDAMLNMRYFVKVTVNRPSLFSRNLRNIVPFVFCPIEPPRPPPKNNQIFVRKKHTLAAPTKNAESGFFGALFRKSSNVTGNSGTVAFEARLPNPTIIVPTEPIPLTFILKRDKGSQGIVYIRSVQVMLGITTYIAAQGFRRELGYLLPILGFENLNITLPPQENEIVIDPAQLLQEGHSSKKLALPDTIPPSFRTCNIAREYTLVLQMGVSASSSAPPEMIQLNCDIKVFSGFKPPPELIQTASQRRSSPQHPTVLPANAKAREARMEPAELPTYDEAIAETLSSSNLADESTRGHYDVEERHFQDVDTWDDDKH
jgi:hypothetical protein